MLTLPRAQPLTSSGNIDWRAYLLKKVNTLIAMQGKPEFEKNLTDESREFVVKSIAGGGAGARLRAAGAARG